MAVRVGAATESRLQLIAPAMSDLDALFEFEVANRAFFEARINARPAEYYSRSGVATAIETARVDAAADKAYQYLIRDHDGLLVGRVNLTSIKRMHFHSAEIGYRIGEAYGGRGYASEAVRLALANGFGALRLARIEAVARPENEASIRVLTRNGFVQFGRSRKSFELQGDWFDRLLFECHVCD